MDGILNTIDNALNNNGYYIDYNNIPTTAVIIAGLVIAVLVAFFGLKLKRILSGLAGLVVGITISAVAILSFNLSGTAAIAVLAVVTILCIVLSAVFIRIGIFILMLLYTASLGIIILPSDQIWALAVSGGVALLVAILAAIFLDPFIIIITGLVGGLNAGQYIGMLIGQENNLILVYGASAGIAIAGIIVQFMMHSKKKIKEEKHVVEKVQESSLESEVEKARMILDEDAPEEDTVGDAADIPKNKDNTDDDIEFIDIDD